MQRRSIALHPLTPLMQEGAGGRAGVRGRVRGTLGPSRRCWWRVCEALVGSGKGGG